MLNKILMPSGGQTTDELLILQWNKKVGDPVKRGDILFEIETDKAVLTVESFAEGTLLEISYGDGSLVKVGETVALIGSPEDKVTSKDKSESPAFDNAKPQPAFPQNGLIQPAMHADKALLWKEGSKIQASPLAKSRARVENIRLEDVAKYLSKNLLKKDDITTYLTFKQKSNSNDEDDAYFIDATSMRKTIARRMKESVAVSPHYTVSVDIDMTGTIELRAKLNASVKVGDTKISYNDLIMKVAAKAIAAHPYINSSFQGDRIKVFKNVHFGLAIAMEGGLVVPVIKNVNSKSLPEIAVANSENINKVRSGGIRESDISGGTITLSSLGMYGMKQFTAIINQPESCILAVGTIINKPVSLNKQVVTRDIMNITASFDHRVIDGAAGAAFLQEVKEILEDPYLLFL